MTFEQVGDGTGEEPLSNGEETNSFVASPLAGSVWSVRVETGQRVEAGDVLFVVESMKAEFEVTAPTSGVVGEVLVRKGQAVRAGQALAMAG